MCGGGPRQSQKEASDLLSYSSKQLAKRSTRRENSPGSQELSEGTVRVEGQVEAREEESTFYIPGQKGV